MATAVCVLGAGAKPAQHHAALSKWRSINACTCGNVVSAGRRLSCLPSIPGAPFQPVHQDQRMQAPAAHPAVINPSCSAQFHNRPSSPAPTCKACSRGRSRAPHTAAACLPRHAARRQPWLPPSHVPRPARRRRSSNSHTASGVAQAQAPPPPQPSHSILLGLAQAQQQPSHSIWFGSDQMHAGNSTRLR